VSWVSRLRLLGGVLGALVLVTACTVLFTQRENRVEATSAEVVAVQYPVGSDFGGTVVQQFVRAGDAVSVGDPIVAVQSPALARDIAEGFAANDTEAYTIDDDGLVTLLTTVPGFVQRLGVPQGGFAAAGQEVALIEGVQDPSVTAVFALESQELARVREGAEVALQLPDGTGFAGTVSLVEVESFDGVSLVTITIESSELAALAGRTVRSGTPVTAVLQLEASGPLDAIVEAGKDLARQVGL
jgi:pyruvate/2-oxoglutarate dehydrogenase complex dihydrolipoamide acyltransferase (E2) component